MHILVYRVPLPHDTDRYHIKLGTRQDAENAKEKPVIRHPIRIVSPRAQLVLKEYYKKSSANAASPKRPASVGIIDFRSFLHDGKHIGYSDWFFPKMMLPEAMMEKTRGSRLGTELERLCTQHFAKDKKITHFAATDAIIEGRDKGTLKPESIPEGGLTRATPDRLGQLARMHISKKRIVPVREWLGKLKS